MSSDPFVCDGGLRSPKQSDELAVPTAQLAAEGGMEAVTVPLLVFQSERDTYVDPEGARKLHERAGVSAASRRSGGRDRGAVGSRAGAGTNTAVRRSTPPCRTVPVLAPQA